jgi:hypothetical protein
MLWGGFENSISKFSKKSRGGRTMPVSFRLFPEACLEKIVEQAIEEGKLFELLFTEEGKKLWERWGEDRIRALVMQKLGVKFEKKKKQRRWQR